MSLSHLPSEPLFTPDVFARFLHECGWTTMDRAYWSHGNYPGLHTWSEAVLIQQQAKLLGA